MKKSKLPRTDSIHEMAEFWDSHDLTDFEDEMDEVVSMELFDNAGDRPSATTTWAVHRQDDNGNRFVVEAALSREEADRLVAILESRGHKQLYWAEAEQE